MAHWPALSAPSRGCGFDSQPLEQKGTTESNTFCRRDPRFPSALDGPQNDALKIEIGYFRTPHRPRVSFAMVAVAIHAVLDSFSSECTHGQMYMRKHAFKYVLRLPGSVTTNTVC